MFRASGICLGNWEGSGAVSQTMPWDPIGTRESGPTTCSQRRLGDQLGNKTTAANYRNASRLRDWALRGRGRRTGGVFDLESTLGRRLGVKRGLELTLKSVKNLRCAESCFFWQASLGHRDPHQGVCNPHRCPTSRHGSQAARMSEMKDMFYLRSSASCTSVCGSQSKTGSRTLRNRCVGVPSSVVCI